MELNYSMQISAADAAKVAKAQRNDVDASFKDLGAVCANISGKELGAAEALLEKAATGNWPIWYPKHNKKLGHRGELGGRKGRYPEKSVKIVLELLRSAKANAEYRGLFGKLRVVHASANKLATYPRVTPRGRWKRADYETAKIEIVLKEIEEAKPEVVKARKKKLEDHATEKRKIREEMEKEERLEAGEEMHEEHEPKKGKDETEGKTEEKHELAEKKRKTEKKLTDEEKKIEKSIQKAEQPK